MASTALVTDPVYPGTAVTRMNACRECEAWSAEVGPMHVLVGVRNVQRVRSVNGSFG